MLPNLGAKTGVQAVDLAMQLAEILDTVCKPVNSAMDNVISDIQTIHMITQFTLTCIQHTQFADV